MQSSQTPAEFFSSGWQAYRATVEHDYLWHALMTDGLRKQIDSRFGAAAPIRFLDLACGDAVSTTRVLKDRPLARYVGVDQSAPALATAATNVKHLHTEVELVTADYVDYVESATEKFDVIYVGLSAHHLGEPGLPRFLAGVRKCLTPNGIFAAFEPFTLPDETRQEHVERICAIIGQFWTNMNPDYCRQVSSHIRACDFPISLERWNTIARQAGLSAASVAVRTPDRLSQLVVHEIAQ
jgi:cyclopropane fatty-acyl-phospholipid synthase-like methyltransferase